MQQIALLGLWRSKFFEKAANVDLPPGFGTEVRYLLRPIPFSVRTYSLPDLFGGVASRIKIV